MIEIENITKVYQMGETEVRALDGVSLKLKTASGLPSPGRGFGQEHADVDSGLSGFADERLVQTRRDRRGEDAR